MSVYFISFANSDWYADSKPLHRIEQEAESLNIFDRIFCFTENDFDQDYIKQYNNRFKERGYGYWQWKPYVVQKVYSQMKFSDILLYCDAGNHLNKKGKKRLLQYIKMLQNSDKSILAFLQPMQERIWTKGDIFKYFNIDYNIFYEKQFWCGSFFLKKNKQSDTFLEDWYNICHNHHELTTDDSSKFENFPSFKENRHDQSALSMLIHARYKDYVLTLSADETYPDGDWSVLWKYPIWACRNQVKEAKRNALRNHYNPMRILKARIKILKKSIKRILCA